MTIRWCVFLCTVLLFSTLQVNAARGFGGRHSYPKSGGLSGGGHSSGHSYPTNHGGLSGSNSNGHAYPSSGGQSHAYPSSTGQKHGYPSSGGSHGYPASGGLSGNSPSRPVAGNTHTAHHTTNVYNNYHYSPPQQIRYTPVHGGAPMSYPVYRGTPPTYVYQYKDSGSKYGTLLAGLALLNLGTLAGVAYAHSGHSSSGSSGSNYKSAPGEVCKFGIRKDNGDYEETRIDCQLITSFIFQSQQEKAQNGGTNTTVVTTTVTNVTMVNGGVAAEPVPAPVPGNIVYTMLPNGTLVPLNGTMVNGTFIPGAVNTTSPAAPSTNGDASSVTTTMTNTTTTVVNALDVKGKPVDVTPGMQCYVIRHTPSSDMKKKVDCGLLQSYATQSLKKNSATRNLPVFTAVAVVAAMLLAY